MKKTLTSFALVTGLISSTLAQPVLTYNSSHSIGTQSTMYMLTDNANILQQGGADVTWDLSASSMTSIGTWDAIDPATAPHSGNYPDANLAFKQDLTGQGVGYLFMIDDASALSNIANDDGSGSPVIWIQYDKLVQYPFNYGDAFTATRQQSGDVPETYTRTYDAYGTLIVNGKTYTDVIRVSKSNGNATWFTTSPKMFPILIQSTSNSYRYNEPANFTTGMDEANITTHAKIYPNPCHDVLMVDAPGALQYEVINMLGQVIETGAVTNNTIHTDQLQKGMYFLLLKDANSGKTSRIFLKE